MSDGADLIVRVSAVDDDHDGAARNVSECLTHWIAVRLVVQPPATPIQRSTNCAHRPQDARRNDRGAGGSEYRRPSQ